MITLDDADISSSNISVEAIEDLLQSCKGLFEKSHFNQARRGYTQIYEILCSIDLVKHLDTASLNSFKRRALLNCSSCCMKLDDWNTVLNIAEQLLKSKELMSDEGNQEWSSIMYFKAYSLKKLGRLGQSYVIINKLVAKTAIQEYITFLKDLKLELQKSRSKLHKGSTGEEILNLAVSNTDYFNAASAYLRVGQSTCTPDEEAIKCIKKAIDIFSHLHRHRTTTTTITTVNTFENEESPIKDNATLVSFPSPPSADIEREVNNLDDSTNSSSGSSSSTNSNDDDTKSREQETRWRVVAGVAYSSLASRLLTSSSLERRQEKSSVLRLLQRAYHELIEPWQSQREESVILHLVTTLRDISQVVGKQAAKEEDDEAQRNNQNHSNLSFWHDPVQVLLEALGLMDEYEDHYYQQNKDEYSLYTLSPRMKAILLQRARLQREIAETMSTDDHKNPKHTEMELWDLASAADLLRLQDLDAVCVQLRRVAQRWEKCDTIDAQFNLPILSGRWSGKSSGALVEDSLSTFNSGTIDRRRRNVNQFFTQVFSFTNNEVNSIFDSNYKKLDYLLETDLCSERVRRLYLALANVTSERSRRMSNTSNTTNNSTGIDCEVGVSLMRAGHCALSLTDAENCYMLAKSKLTTILSLDKLNSHNSYSIKVHLVDVCYHFSYSLQLQGRIEEALEEALSAIKLLYHCILSNTMISSKKGEVLKRLWLLRGQVAVCMAVLSVQKGWTAGKDASTLQSLRIFIKSHSREAVPPTVLQALEQLEQSDVDSVMEAIGVEMNDTTKTTQDSKNNDDDSIIDIDDALEKIHLQIVEDSWQRVQIILQTAIRTTHSNTNTNTDVVIGTSDTSDTSNISDVHESRNKQTINTASDTKSNQYQRYKTNVSPDPFLLFVTAILMAICLALLVAPRLNKWALEKQQQQCLQNGICPND